MSARFPIAKIGFGQLDNANLVTQGQNIHDGLLSSIADYPTPPVLPAALQTLINTYSTDLSASIGGSQVQRSKMHASRKALKNAIRVDAAYVNNIASGMVQAGGSYVDVTNSILGTGYFIGTQPSPAGPLPSPTVKSFGSPQKGQFKILLFKVPNARGYEVRLGDLTLGTQETLTFSNTRILMQGLISGHEYVAELATIGANITRTYTTQVFQIVT